MKSAGYYSKVRSFRWNQEDRVNKIFLISLRVFDELRTEHLQILTSNQTMTVRVLSKKCNNLANGHFFHTKSGASIQHTYVTDQTNHTAPIKLFFLFVI